MYCTNCGHKLNENAVVCLNCGVLVKSSNTIEPVKVNKKKKKGNVSGIVSIILSIISLILCFRCFRTDISEVGMYTKIFERFFYALGFILIPLILSIIALILSLINKKKTLNLIGLLLTLASLFLIITEVVVILIY